MIDTIVSYGMCDEVKKQKRRKDTKMRHSLNVHIVMVQCNLTEKNAKK